MNLLKGVKNFFTSGTLTFNISILTCSYHIFEDGSYAPDFLHSKSTCHSDSNKERDIDYMFCVSRIKVPTIEKRGLKKMHFQLAFFKACILNSRDADICFIALNASPTMAIAFFKKWFLELLYMQQQSRSNCCE